jgi:transcriptional regulator with XRE-family HTH domain
MGSISNESHTMDVGGRLRQLRSERGKSMRALARASGLSTNALSMIERGRTSPSVSTLYKLADALEVPITAFFRLEPERMDVVFRKKADRRKMKILNGVWEGLGGEAFTGKTEAFVLSLDSEASSGPYGMLHTGSEFVLCLEGKLEYEVEDQQYVLEAGDSLIFAAQLQHRWRNICNGITRVVIVISGFEYSERPSEFHLVSQKLAGRVLIEEI